MPGWLKSLATKSRNHSLSFLKQILVARTALALPPELSGRWLKSTIVKIIQQALHFGIDICHHGMALVETISTHAQNRIDIAILHIEVRTGLKVDRITFPFVSVKYYSIYLHCK